MRNPQKREESKKTFVPLVPPNLLENIEKFYEKLHALDVKYTAAIFTTVQKYTVLRITSKVFGKFSDGPALPIFFLLYWYKGNTAPWSFALYTCLWVCFHEFGIKNFFHRHRPSTAGGQKGFSFPSSHSFASGLILSICLYFLLPWSGLLIALAITNVINRIALGVHYLADVTAGFTIGILAGLGWPLILGIVRVALP